MHYTFRKKPSNNGGKTLGKDLYQFIPKYEGSSLLDSIVLFCRIVDAAFYLARFPSRNHNGVYFNF